MIRALPVVGVKHERNLIRASKLSTIGPTMIIAFLPFHLECNGSPQVHES